MSVLSDRALRDIGPSLIDPWDPGMVQPASVDLRLHDEIWSFGQVAPSEIDMADVKPEGFPFRVSKGYLLRPGEFCLGGTAELLRIPADCVGRIEGKSSVGRLGLMVHVTAGFIDPGFSGRITLEICNLRRVSIVLRPGLAICQLSLAFLDQPAERPYSGRYQGDRGVTPSRFGSEINPGSHLRY